jgi:hypothetical protein
MRAGVRTGVHPVDEPHGLGAARGFHDHVRLGWGGEELEHCRVPIDVHGQQSEVGSRRWSPERELA